MKLETTYIAGQTVGSISGHGFKCSDGSYIPPQSQEVVDFFKIHKIRQRRQSVAGFSVY